MRQFANRPLLCGSTGPVPKQVTHLTLSRSAIQIGFHSTQDTPTLDGSN